MRGDHPGSFEVAHQLRDSRRVDLSTVSHTNETFDLVIVGGGISGLGAAYYFLTGAGRNARVLILDNHDDFGGHAKRNEFRHAGRLLAINGGTLNIEAPQRYNEAAKSLLATIGIDLDRFQTENATNRNLYRSLGLGRGHFFDKENWGADRLVVRPPTEFTRGSRGGYSTDFLEKTPLTEQARKDLLRLYNEEQPDYLSGMPSADKKVRLAKMSYQDFLLNVAKVDRQVLWFFRHFGEGVFCVGADATPALFAWQMGQPGFSGLQLEPAPDGVLAELPGVQHGRQKEGEGTAETAAVSLRTQSPA
jgi:spermidine dehydrogenase